jgi:hypothetical protein
MNFREWGWILIKSHWRPFLTAALLLSASNGLAVGQTVKLLCNGMVHQYEPNRVDGTASGAATVDIDGKRIVTPVGQFRITKVEETAIYFDDPRKQLKVFGYLDRLTGKMTVLWRRPEEDFKGQSGLQHKMSMYSELSCLMAKPLF